MPSIVFRHITLSLLALIFALGVKAQTRYNMSNQTVNDCEGILVDSETGNDDFPTGYYHNENLTFTICVNGSDGITLDFSFFQLEDGKDFMYIYDGPDANAPLLGTYTGNNRPGAVLSSGDCLTIVFTSDPNVNAEGWEATWNATPPPPPTPNILPIPNVACGSTTVTIQLDQDIPCNQFVPGNFIFSGPSTPAITSVTPTDCVNGFARTAQITFAGPLDESGTYCMEFALVYIDKCNQSYFFNPQQCFQIIDCPLDVEIREETLVCYGACLKIYADVSGGNPNTYQYTWSTGETTDTILVCPTVQTSYSVSVTDGASQPATDNHTVNIKPAPEAGNDTSMCRFDSDFRFTGTPPGGKWYGQGILNDSLRFRPSYQGTGEKTIYYIAPNGCVDSLTVDVHYVNAAGGTAACTGSNDIQLNGAPAGGTWTGPNVSPTGVFTPNAEGTFTLTYTEPNNGCQANTTVTVINELSVPKDTIQACINQEEFRLYDTPESFNPRGGSWSGNGIVNGYWGTFNPYNAGVGTHKLYYNANGCRDSSVVQVFDIDAGGSQYYCPEHDIVPLNTGVPTGGTWSGPGVIDNMDGTYSFNPNYNGNNNGYANIEYEFQGCTAPVFILLEYSTIDDTVLQFCAYDDPTFIQVDSLHPNYGEYGTWYGDFFNTNNDSILDIPSITGSSTKIYYEVANNGCPDSILVNIIPKPDAGPDITGVCPASDDITLSATPPGGTWSGYGITDANAGIFSPQSVGVNGNFPVVYNSQGCLDTAVIRLQSSSPNINITKNYYCSIDSLFNLIATPTGGTWSGPGVNSSGQFNPITAGPGNHTINYTVGSGACAFAAAPKQVTVLAPLQVSSNYLDTTLCYGDSIPVTLTMTDGDPFKDYTFSWTPYRPNSQQIYAKPDGPTTYSVKVSDGCSDTATYSFTINSYDPIQYQFSQAATVCHGDSSWLAVIMPYPGVDINDYLIKWETYPYQTINDTLFAPAGQYKVRIQDKVSGCYIDDKSSMASYPYINADFTFLQDGCLSIADPKLNIIDLSTGGTSGTWSFSDTLGAPYDGYTNHEIIYPDSGSYTVTLTIANAGGCTSTKTAEVCVRPEKKIFLSNTFTPDGDGHNETWPAQDFYRNKRIPMGYGIVDYEFEIFTRWGEQIYQSNLHGNEPWNGRYQNGGDIQKSDVYIFKMLVEFYDGEKREIIGHVNLLP